MKNVHPDVLKAIGNTPIVKLNKVAADCEAEVYVKLEFINPGGSIKDRLGYWLVKDAEEKGQLKPGGTIIEGTSGNTGFGLAITAAVKGYRSVFVLPDKMSDEKIKSLRAFGAKVVVTPTAVEPEDPRSYYSVSKRLAKETPNSLYMDQYNNLANRECHYNWTGPEILEQMPDLDVFIAGIGTGGTICGVGKYLKENKSDAQIVAVDPVGSLVYDYFKTGKMVPAHTYKIEGIGEDFIPANYDFSVVDDMVKVEDKESFVMTRRLLTEEGIYSGVSSGSAVVGALRWIKSQGDAMKGKKVLIVLPDSGNRYLSKVYDDDWMEEAGFMDHQPLGTVRDLINRTNKGTGNIITALPSDKVSTVIDILKDKSISQVPVKDENGWVKGIVREKELLNALFENKISPTDNLESVMESSIEFVKMSDSVEKVAKLITTGKVPLVTKDDGSDILSILTTIDLVTYMGER